MYITLLLLQVLYYSLFLEQLHKATRPCSLMQKCLMVKVYLRMTKPTRGMSPKLHISGCLACFLSNIPARLSTQMEIHLLPAPSSLFFLFYSQLHPTPPSSLFASRSPVPHCVLIRQFILFLWVPSTICGCHSQSPCQGSIPSHDLDDQPHQCCSVNPLPHIFLSPKARFLNFALFFCHMQM